MLRQKCRVETPEGQMYIKGIKLDGDLELTEKVEDAMVLMNHHWSEMIKRCGLCDHKPYLIDMND
jgi:hypothetical protein